MTGVFLGVSGFSKDESKNCSYTVFDVQSPCGCKLEVMNPMTVYLRVRIVFLPVIMNCNSRRAIPRW
ncbi:unnamed protein product [Allacma fusca]|uniref:Uncharacterized protein n=1 Tax=Allacma fusca TaxID=39272 RepID=A0A8J2L506_9HEXA|nr:unnamed protein product [Allacma fusca]